MRRYDSIVIGAGHNGLVCANYLARSGQRVLVLESSESPGGLASENDFYPGFRTSVAHTVSYFSRKVSRDLDLESHGLLKKKAQLATIGLSVDGSHVILKDQKLFCAGSTPF